MVFFIKKMFGFDIFGSFSIYGVRIKSLFG